MLRPSLLIAGCIAKGHDQWRAAIARLRPRSLQDRHSLVDMDDPIAPLN